MTKLKPTLEEIQAIDISHLYPLAKDNDDNRRLLRGDAGVEHYKLLVWFARQFNEANIAEIGTLGGLGTIALAENPTNFVTSFDIRSYSWGNETPENAEKKIVYDGYMDEVVKADLIFYDAAHEGKEEREFFNELIERKWKGILVLDDIHLNNEMEEFWSEILNKHHAIPSVQSGNNFIFAGDWTDIGHATGTGVVVFE